MIWGNTPRDTFLRTSSRFLIWLKERNAAGLLARIPLFYILTEDKPPKSCLWLQGRDFHCWNHFESSTLVETGPRITNLTQDRSQDNKEKQQWVRIFNEQGGNSFCKSPTREKLHHYILKVQEVMHEDFPVMNVIYPAGYLLMKDCDILDQAELFAVLWQFGAAKDLCIKRSK